jgi:hypothetical protein
MQQYAGLVAFLKDDGNQKLNWWKNLETNAQSVVLLAIRQHFIFIIKIQKIKSMN